MTTRAVIERQARERRIIKLLAAKPLTTLEIEDKLGSPTAPSTPSSPPCVTSTAFIPSAFLCSPARAVPHGQSAPAHRIAQSSRPKESAAIRWSPPCSGRWPMDDTIKLATLVQAAATEKAYIAFIKDAGADSNPYPLHSDAGQTFATEYARLEANHKALHRACVAKGQVSA